MVCGLQSSVYVCVPVDVNFIQFITNWLLTLFFGTFHILVNDANNVEKLCPLVLLRRQVRMYAEHATFEVLNEKSLNEKKRAVCIVAV